MPEPVERIEDIPKLAEFLTGIGSRPFSLFVGSTISCAWPAHAPSVEDIVQSLFDELVVALDDTPILKDKVDAAMADPAVKQRRRAIPFESLWERVARVVGTETVADTLTRLCAGGEPNWNHRAIAWLVRKGYVRRIFTTNYDEFIEKALQGPEARPGFSELSPLDPMVLKATVAAECPSRQAELIKLHGTLSKRSSMAFMFPQITAGVSTDTESILRQFLREYPVLFAGYGCNDWDLRQLLRTPITWTLASFEVVLC